MPIADQTDKDNIAGGAETPALDGAARGTKLPAELVAELRARRAAGESLRTLAKSTGIAKSTIHDALKTRAEAQP